jgi:Fe-S-cluster containining protein
MELDCTTCGACCVGLTVYLSTADEARLSADEVLALTQMDSEGRFRQMKQLRGGACIALLRDASGRFLCRIYDRRPDACSEFERGSRRCHALREIRTIS